MTHLDTKTNHWIDTVVNQSWTKIAPFWPLKNLIAINPLQGLQDVLIEQALFDGAVFFEQKELPKKIELINRLTIKWLQAFFDDGQAAIEMPSKINGLYASWKNLVCFDEQIHQSDIEKKQWLLQLPKSSHDAIIACFSKLNIPEEKHSIFLTLMLTTLPGWASHVKYQAEFSEKKELESHKILKKDYIALRIIITTMLWQDAIEIIDWYEALQKNQAEKMSPIETIKKAEKKYIVPLVKTLTSQKIDELSIADAQIIFCIDVRSESFRKNLENQGHYETFGCAGFFGLPISIKNSTTGELYASCPVLLESQHVVMTSPCSLKDSRNDSKGYQNLNVVKYLYQSLKYNVTTSFLLVELLGLLTGLWMGLKTLAPLLAYNLRNGIRKIIRQDVPFTMALENISLSDQCMYAEFALKSIGLTKNFSSIIVFCGHASSSENNAYATMLDCGACQGHHGGNNAKIIAKILNLQTIRAYLHEIGINIPQSTIFLAAEHNTTTDNVEMYEVDSHDIDIAEKIKKLKNDCKQAGQINSQERCKRMGFHLDKNDAAKHMKNVSVDWAQTRPEWGLARNASFIVAPRQLSKKIDCQGRAFLHSYDYTQDLDGVILTVILTAPMIVAQWINTQYLFSTLDNVAYGSGSKVTHNITGKLGVMQGNASDLMTGLPLQSVYTTDFQAYHEPVRLATIVYAPCSLLDRIIQEQQELQNLFRNGWVLLVCINPEDNNQYFLDRDLTWKKDF